MKKILSLALALVISFPLLGDMFLSGVPSPKLPVATFEACDITTPIGAYVNRASVHAHKMATYMKSYEKTLKSLHGDNLDCASTAMENLFDELLPLFQGGVTSSSKKYMHIPVPTLKDCTTIDHDVKVKLRSLMQKTSLHARRFAANMDLYQ